MKAVLDGDEQVEWRASGGPESLGHGREVDAASDEFVGGGRDGVDVTVEVRALHLDQRLLKNLMGWPEDTEH